MNNFMCILSILIIQIINLVLTQRQTACINAPNGAQVRSSTSCSDYFTCVNGEAIGPSSCSTQLKFDAITTVCNYDYNVDCLECSRYGIQNLKDPTDCSKYYKCEMGVRTHQQCPVNLHFHSEIGQCNFKENANCKVETSICANYPNDVLTLPDPESCSSYIICVFGSEFPNDCPPNLYWNSNLEQCDIYEESDCYISSVPSTESPEITDSDEDISSSTIELTEPTESTEPTTEIVTQTTPIDDESTEDPLINLPICCTPFNGFEFDCPRFSLFPTFLPFQGSCRLYVRCLLGFGFVNICPKHRYWNHSRRRCDATRPSCQR